MSHNRSNSRKPFDILQVVRQLEAVKKLERDLRISQSEFSELQRKASHEVCMCSVYDDKLVRKVDHGVLERVKIFEV